MNLKRISLVITAAMVICLAGASQIFAAVDAYMTIEGTNQGKFKGEATGVGAGKIAISEFNYMANAPADKKMEKMGIATGRRQHSAITITKSIDKSSPLLMQAMKSGEVLKSVDIEFFHPSPKGPEVYKTLHLTNAVITSIQASGAGAGKTEAVTISAESESFQATGMNGGKSAMDAWDAK